MNRANIAVTTVIAALTLVVWAFVNRPHPEPAWPERILGFSFSPMRAGQDPIKGQLPSPDEIDADLALLSGKTHAVRTYSVSGTLGDIPALARAYDINVALGAWIGGDLVGNDKELGRLIEIAHAHYANIVRVVVGNEAVHRGDVSGPQIIGYLDRVRSELQTPVSTAEPWYVWLEHPELAEHVDYLAVHILPYWEGVHVDDAVQYLVERVNQLREAFPGKRIVLAEVGWPSRGRMRGAAVASLANQATFLRRFLARADQERYTYYLIEAFDQPWKRSTEGAVGAYWGVYDVERQPKFAFERPVIRVPAWRGLALASILIAAAVLALVLVDSVTLRARGRSFLGLVVFGAATAAVWIVYDYLQQYFTVTDAVVGALLFLAMLGVIVVLLAEAHEWAEALWVSRRRRPLQPARADDVALPMVSVHVPAYNEPPEMLIQTLDALASLDYPRYEVIVIDNNTRDPAAWEPVQAHCASLGPRFRFFHVAPLSGFKAGALNFTLARTHADAQAVAVIDSDYVVDPRWLRDLMPQLAQPHIAIVQAPQDYRDRDASLFKAMCYEEYRGFFQVGMVTRNDRNAIIQHGTMTIVRREVLEKVGGWGESCITEDAELGLRVFGHGYAAAYTPSSYGRGLMPDNFADYKQQRFRWAYGAIQILRQHAPILLGLRPSGLSNGQRYHFLGGWLPWMADGMNLLFTLVALAWSVGMTAAPQTVDPPLLVFSVLPLSLFLFKIAKSLHLYRRRMATRLGGALAATVAGLSLSHTIAMAVLSGMVSTDKPFFRTPKLGNAQGFFQALAAAREEGLLMLALWLAAAGVLQAQGHGGWDVSVWTLMLLVQSLPYLSSLIVSVISSMPVPSRQPDCRRTAGSGGIEALPAGP